MKSLFLILCSITCTLSSLAQITTIKRPAAVVSSSSCCGFRAGNSSDIPMAVSFGKENTLVFDKEVFDDANAFNGAAFKTPADGVYQFTVQLGLKAKNTSSDISQVMLRIKTASQSSIHLINIPASYDNVISGELTALFKLKAGEEVSVVVVGLGSATAATTGNISFFSGVKLY